MERRFPRLALENRRRGGTGHGAASGHLASFYAARLVQAAVCSRTRVLSPSCPPSGKVADPSAKERRLCGAA